MEKNKKYKFFWSGKYSNWHKADLGFRFEPDTVPGIDLTYYKFNCVEQYMMFAKAVLFQDFESAKKILEEKEPNRQKKLGREIKGFDSRVWDEKKYEVVKLGVLAKFSQNKELREAIVSEDCNLFVEASPYDKIWGIGLDVETAANTLEERWPGENLLGKILTEVRDFLKQVDNGKAI